MLPIVVALRNPKLKHNHFVEIENIIKIRLEFDTLLLQDLLQPNVLDH